MQTQSDRRAFLRRTAASGLGWVVLKDSRSARGYVVNERLQVALVGAGGRGGDFLPDEGWSSVRQQIGGRIAALCDVNRQRAAKGFEAFPDLPQYEDFREMIDQRASQLDAVVVATPDHTHAAPSAYALRAGLHVFCEKGLTRTVHEARVLARLTVETQRSTQMGNQAGYNTNVVEHIWAGTLGSIQAIHMWGGGGSGPRPLPSGTHDVPAQLNWDLWLGPAAYRPYHPEWMQWGRWRDFANGHPGMWGAHHWATIFKAMKLDTLWPVDKKPPIAGQKTIQVTAEVSEVPEATFPRWSVVHWDIPARMDMPPIRLSWYAGAGGMERFQEVISELFQQHPEWGRADDDRWKTWTGNLWVGTQGVMRTFGHGCSTVDMLPSDKFGRIGRPPELLPRPLAGKFLRGWAQHINGGPVPEGCFNKNSGPLTEWSLLANVATRFPEQTLQFDPVACRIINHAEADAELRPPYRDGWML